MKPSFSAIILTLFPEMFPGPLGLSLAGKALKEGLWSLKALQIRDFATDKHHTVDDTPYGGGAGMVMRPDVVDAAIKSALCLVPCASLIYFTPRGVPFTQALAKQLISLDHLPLEGGGRRAHLSAVALAQAEGTTGGGDDTGFHTPHLNPPPQGGRKSASLILLCGRYEGVDERVLEAHKPLEISVGDVVLSGGEIAALVLLDACVRLLPGVVGDSESLSEESFGLGTDFAGLLEYPHYSKPPVWNGRAVPDVLMSGDHGKIKDWRLSEAKKATKTRRPDLWKRVKEG